MWTLRNKYRIQNGSWSTDSTAKVIFTVVKEGTITTPPPAPTGPTGVTGTSGPTGVTGPLPAPVVGEWLSTKANKIVKSDGTVWMGRGANLFDTRGCNACSTKAPNVDEVKRRIDEIVKWGGTFIRLALESGLDSSLVNYRPITQDAQYLADIKTITDYVMTKPGLYMEVSLWIDSSFSNTPVVGWPTATTIETWKILTKTLNANPRLMFGLVNEPQNNFSGSYDAQCWTAMNNTVQAIRDVEASLGTTRHLIAVQGTRAWSRILTYYMTHPITAGGGANIVYETHVYDGQADFNELFVNPSQVLPVIIGEFGPVDWAGMFLPDTQAMMDKADALKVPWLAWSFHGRCPPNLIVDNSSGGCGVGMVLNPTPWGQQVKTQLAKPLP